MPKINYLIATWSGDRRNPSTQYLRMHLKRLCEIQHSIDQITIIKPLGSDNKDFYDLSRLPTDRMNTKIVILERPENDRSYGQFFYAYKQYRKEFDYYILSEDDYIPNLDDFDSILIDLLRDKKADYICGKYGHNHLSDPMYPQQNMGIVNADAFEKILSTDPSPLFYPNGTNDGQEQLMFAKLFHKNGLIIKDYVDNYPVPIWDRYLDYWGPLRGIDTLFVPYQFLYCKAFTSALDTEADAPDPDSHFLQLLKFNPIGNNFDIYIENTFIGKLVFERNNKELYMSINIVDKSYPNHFIYTKYVSERQVFFNRSERLYQYINKSSDDLIIYKKLGWVVDDNKATVGSQTLVRISKKYAKK